MQFSSEQKLFFSHVNDLQYGGQKQGHYESYFLRANHPSRPLAFWVRYTIFSPRNNPEQALGEVWAIWFDGEKDRNVAAKVEVPFSKSIFFHDHFEVSCAGCVLNSKELKGSLQLRGNNLSWNLTYSGKSPPALFYPVEKYKAKIPQAKVVSCLPIAQFNGEFVVNGESFKIDQWIGSQNHNWGPKHTDRYAWCQVSGFDNAPESFLEAASGKLKIGPFWTPYLTPVVLRHHGEEYAINTIWQSFMAKMEKFDYFNWKFSTRNDRIEIQGHVSADRSEFIGLNYYNPPGGSKHCLNSKLAKCELTITDLKTNRQEILIAKNRCAFEIITDDRNHGIEIST